MKTVELAIIVAGVCTWLLRFLPMAGMRIFSSMPKKSFKYKMLQALGPTAIAALVAMSLSSLLRAHDFSLLELLSLAAGVAAVAAVQRFTDNLALSTLLPALIYGVIRSAPHWLG